MQPPLGGAEGRPKAATGSNVNGAACSKSCTASSTGCLLFPDIWQNLAEAELALVAVQSNMFVKNWDEAEVGCVQVLDACKGALSLWRIFAALLTRLSCGPVSVSAMWKRRHATRWVDLQRVAGKGE